MITSKGASKESLADSLKTPNASLFAKAVGRERKPAWGNRFLKDFYDLDYDLPHSLTKETSKREHINKREVVFLTNKVRYNPQKIQMGAGESALGLCPYEYHNTIEGRMKQRSNHHLSFQKNRVNRSVNERAIYYNRDTNIDLTRSQILEKKNAIAANHSFASYTSRRTFEPRDQLDKIFDTDKGLTLASPRRSPSAIRRFDSMVERKEAKPGESTLLEYDLSGGDKLKKHSISYSIGSQERNTHFYPQIIDPTRGCYR